MRRRPDAPTPVRARLRVPNVRLWPNHELRKIDDERDLDTRLAVQRLIHLDHLVCRGEYEPLKDHRVSGLRSRDDHISVANGWWRQALIDTGARKHGKDYAREIRDNAIRCGYVVDSGETDSPRGPGRYKQEGGCRWWVTYLVPALLRPQPCGAYGVHVPAQALPDLRPSPYDSACAAKTKTWVASTASLWRNAISQAPFLHPKRLSECSPGSVQWAFQHTGPP